MPAPFAEPFPELVHDRPAIQVLHELTSNPTRGLVKRLLPSLPPKDTLLMLLNALHFAGKWPDGTIERNDTEESKTADIRLLNPKRYANPLELPTRANVGTLPDRGASQTFDSEGMVTPRGSG